MKKILKSFVSVSISAAMLSAMAAVPAFADGETPVAGGLQDVIAKHINALGEDILAADYNTTDRSVSVKVDADTKIKEAGTSNDYSDGVLTKSETIGTALSDTFDYQAYLYMDNVKETFKAYQAAAEEYGQVSPVVGQALNNVPVSGEFTIDVYYPNTFEIADMDSFTNADGSMYGFNEEAKNVFFDTERTIEENALTDTITVNSVDYDVTYNKLTVKAQVKGFGTDASAGESLTYKEMADNLDACFANMTFTVPSATQTLSEDTPVGYYYYSVGIDMTGYVDIGIGRDGQGVRYSRVNFDTVQQAGSENAAEDQYIGENLLSKSDITSTFYYNIRNRSTGGGGYSGGVNTPRPTATAQPGATSEPGATADPNATPNPGETPGSQSTPAPQVYPNIDPPSALNSEDHFVYVIGYPEGDVRPLNSISREEVATIFYRLLNADVRDDIFTKESSFTDVAKSRWSNKAIASMANGEYVKGDAGTTLFRPADAITRAEFITIATRFLDNTDVEGYDNNFSDISGHWAEDAIKLGVSVGWLAGYEDGTFRPDRQITRAEAMTIINRVLNRFVDAEGLSESSVAAEYVKWPDNPTSEWYYYNVVEATNSHDYTRRADGHLENWTEITTNQVWVDKAQYEDPDPEDVQ